MLYTFLAQRKTDTGIPYADKINKFPISIGMTGWCLELKELLVYEPIPTKGFGSLGNSKHYIHYSDEVDNYENLKIFNAMYVPVFDGLGEIAGVMQLFNKKDQEPFNQLDVLYF